MGEWIHAYIHTWIDGLIDIFQFLHPCQVGIPTSIPTTHSTQRHVVAVCRSLETQAEASVKIHY
jgi:hypothetical protein